MNGDGSQQLRMVDAALGYAELGLPVFPVFNAVNGVCTCSDGVACKRPAKHPRVSDWAAAATTDATMIRAWWARNPHSNIAIVTGARSGVVVIDVDGPRGLESIERLGALPITPMSLTASGYHLLRAHPGTPVKTEANVLPGIDVRGDGGYIIAPPSVHVSGWRYAWAPGRRVGAIELAPYSPVTGVPTTGGASSDTHEADRREAYTRGAVDAESSSVRTSAPGTRNDTLNRAAFKLGQLVASGALDVSVLRNELTKAAHAVGLEDLEIRRTIKSGLDGALKKGGREVPEPSRANGHAHSSAPRAASASSAPPPSDAPGGIVVVGVPEIFAPLPPSQWAVPGLQIGPGRPAMIAGYGASAKTLAAQQMALAKASGTPIWNQYACSVGGKVLHLDYEQGKHASMKRYQRLARGHGIDAGALGLRLFLGVLPRVYLDDADAQEKFLAAFDGYELVIIDALRGAAPASDENDSSIRRTLDLLTYASERTGAASIVLHHAGKPKADGDGDKRMITRGSSAIFDACGCVLIFEASKSGNGPKRVSQQKQPAEAEGPKVPAFELTVDDIAIDGNANAGVTVTWSAGAPSDPSAQAIARFGLDAERLLAVVRANSGITANSLIERAGMGRTRAFKVLGALVDERRLMTFEADGSKRYRVAGDS